MDHIHSPLGFLAIGVFLIAYVFVMIEDKIHMRKSKPVLLAAGIIWVLVALAYSSAGEEVKHAEELVEHDLLEYAKLFLFLLVAMTYVNTLEERRVFDALKAMLVSKGFSLRSIFWITGGLAFMISPVADNLTTALLMGTVVLTVARDKPKFILLACINIVVAANAGGAFSPFGDITTLMVWQKGHVAFEEFFALFIPSLVNWLVPAAIMSFFVPNEKPVSHGVDVEMKSGAWVIMGLFIITIATAVVFENVLHLPAAIGMMFGLGYLTMYSYIIKLREMRDTRPVVMFVDGNGQKTEGADQPFDFFERVRRAEWDTMVFFYGVMLCVGGLGAFGYLAFLSDVMYSQFGHTQANVFIGLLSAVVDNIPVMYAVLNMHPDMSHGQWLLVTLTAGVGGSLLSIGSAAGVALMTPAKGMYGFWGHLRWTPVIALGYGLSIWVHMTINARLF